VRWWAVGAVAAVLLLGGAARRLASESAPPLVIDRTVGEYGRLPGSFPVLAWPRAGQAAIEVAGVGGAGTSGGHTPVPIASVAKIMTAYVTLAEHPLAAGESGFVITITRADVAEQQQRAALGESTLAVRAGERITEREALEALLLPSANNIAALLAAHASGGAKAFVAEMNATAAALGMTSTTYTDPSGFEDATVSTAADQLKLADVAMREPVFAAIVAKPAVKLPLVGRVANYDGLVGRDGYVGVKTGSDRAAGGCLVFAKRVLIDGRRATVLGVVLGQREGSLIEAALTSARQLGDSAAAALRSETALPAGTTVLSASADYQRRTTAVTSGPLTAIGWGGLSVPVDQLLRPARTHLSAGDRMATVTLGGASDASVGAVATRAVDGPSLGWRLRHVL
jgi:serine-type D-Ala-D-Ala carboxypeptidase (penicillin-binding protein 5/6)